MMSTSRYFGFTYLSMHLLIYSGTVYSATFTLVNQCSYPVWPGLLSGAGTPPLSTTGFLLSPGASNSLFVPLSWSGRIWGRTLCTLDPTGKFTCTTADCGSGTVECAGSGAIPPATLAEFTLNGADGLDFYDVSLVDGYNLPMTVVPSGGTSGNCSATGCSAELNSPCPMELKVIGGEGGSESVACKSACEAFGDAKYCCNGEYGTPDTFTCASADYTITFCPSPAPGYVFRSNFCSCIVHVHPVQDGRLYHMNGLSWNLSALIFSKQFCDCKKKATSLRCQTIKPQGLLDLSASTWSIFGTLISSNSVYIYEGKKATPSDEAIYIWSMLTQKQ